ncbi:Serine-rich protein-related [Fagus crenata]
MASKNASPPPKSSTPTRTCLCSPTKHPGSFRCSLHRNPHPQKSLTRRMVRVSRSQWELAVIAKANSFKAFLLQIIKPSSHDLQRRRNFQPKPTRFCMMNKKRDVVAVS